MSSNHNQKTDLPLLPYLTAEQTQALAGFLGVTGSLHVTNITEYNHVWRLQSQSDSYFLKAFTKDWYGEDIAATAYCVRHEESAYACLAAHGVPAVQVVLARTDRENPLGRPFIVTRQLPGEPLPKLLAQADPSQFRTLLEATGNHLRQMHSITFAYPGFIIDDGPTAPPDPNAWQSPYWSAKGLQTQALASLEADRPLLTPALAARLEAIFAEMDTVLAPAFQPPRFVQVNLHGNHFFLYPTQTGWQVSGCIDMEVASAGDPISDLVGFALEMAATYPNSTQWWEPLFAGYGGAPDFEQFRLRMLGSPAYMFKIFGESRWTGTRQQILEQFLAARNWHELFGPVRNDLATV